MTYQRTIDYGTTTAERRRRNWVVYARSFDAAQTKAADQHPATVQLTDWLLVRSDHLGVDEWMYNVEPVATKPA